MSATADFFAIRAPVKVVVGTVRLPPNRPKRRAGTPVDPDNRF